MDKSHPVNSPMIVRSLNMKDDPFRPQDENEEILGPEVPYLSAIGALMYLANNTRPDIACSVNLLARKDATLIGYADAGYFSDPQKAKSQTGYLFTYGGIAISWKSTKQTLTATSSNHAKLIALYEAGRECVWLRSMISNIQEGCGMNSITENPTIIHEDNTACIAQVTE
ncbi:secreted RxLR effector protein 161-like [Spinacia oleracea]|uniref:Secreted RxLR effector protein 161-like n=1 Tax=Spinacia oleracea TaxID=3562 RepID=A0ABM3RS18_SPIOL|nr:secreted RxLR effector protein 161-like [Spinacia oleracea]